MSNLVSVSSLDKALVFGGVMSSMQELNILLNCGKFLGRGMTWILWTYAFFLRLPSALQ